MTADKLMEFHIRPSNAETEATTSSITYRDHTAKQQQSKIYGTSLNEQMRFEKELFVHWIKFEAKRKAIGVQQLWKTIE